MEQPVYATLPESHPTLGFDVVAAIEDALIVRGIECGPLRSAAGVPATLNLTLTDLDTVFVKVMRDEGGYQRAVTELTSAQWAADHGVPVALPLLSEPLWVKDRGNGAFVVTAWAFRRTGAPPPLMDQMTAAVDYVAALAVLPPPPMAVVRGEDTWFHDRALRMHSECESSHAEALLGCTVTAWQTIAAVHESRSEGPLVWCHGDPHVGNLLWPTDTDTKDGFGGSVLIDWEAATAGTGLEPDLAQLLRSAWTYRSDDPTIDVTERVAAEDHARTLISNADDEHQWRLDWSLLDAHLTHRISGSLSRRVNTDPHGNLTRALLGRLGLHA